jgi:hypothetical protein
MVRDQVQGLGGLYSSFTLYVIQGVRLIAANDAVIQFQHLPPPKSWDAILPKVDIRLKTFAFNTIKNDVRNAAVYKVIAVLDATALELSHGYLEGLRWMDLYEYMKSEEFRDQNRGSLRELGLNQCRTNLFQLLEAMSHGLDRACETFSGKWEILKSDPGYAKHAMACSPHIMQDLFDQVFTRDREWADETLMLPTRSFSRFIKWRSRYQWTVLLRSTNSFKTHVKRSDQSLLNCIAMIHMRTESFRSIRLQVQWLRRRSRVWRPNNRFNVCYTIACLLTRKQLTS